MTHSNTEEAHDFTIIILSKYIYYETYSICILLSV